MARVNPTLLTSTNKTKDQSAPTARVTANFGGQIALSAKNLSGPKWGPLFFGRECPFESIVDFSVREPPEKAMSNWP